VYLVVRVKLPSKDECSRWVASATCTILLVCFSSACFLLQHIQDDRNPASFPIFCVAGAGEAQPLGTDISPSAERRLVSAELIQLLQVF